MVKGLLSRSGLLAVGLSVATVGTVFADGPTPTPTGGFLKSYTDPRVSAPLDTPWWQLSLDLGLKLLLIVALIYLTVWLLRRFMGVPRSGFAGQSAMNVLDTTHLAPNRAVYLMEVGGRVLVIGATQTQMTTLSEIVDSEQVQALKKYYERPEGPKFGEQLRSLADRLGVNQRDRNDVAEKTVEPGLSESGAFLLEKIAEIQRLSKTDREP